MSAWRILETGSDKMSEQEELFKLSKILVPGGVHSPVRSFKGLHTTPRFINKADGAYLTDVEGLKYLDFCMSFGPLILGHQPLAVKAALQEQLERGWSYGACESYSLDLASFIIETHRLCGANSLCKFRHRSGNDCFAPGPRTYP